MNSQVTVSQPAAFAVYAGKDVSKWEVLIDREIVHRKHGPGHVTRAYLSDFGFRVRVHFDHLETSPERPLVSWEFLDGSIQSISLPVDFCELDTFIAEQGE